MLYVARSSQVGEPTHQKWIYIDYATRNIPGHNSPTKGHTGSWPTARVSMETESIKHLQFIYTHTRNGSNISFFWIQYKTCLIHKSTSYKMTRKRKITSRGLLDYHLTSYHKPLNCERNTIGQTPHYPKWTLKVLNPPL